MAPVKKFITAGEIYAPAGASENYVIKAAAQRYLCTILRPAAPIKSGWMHWTPYLPYLVHCQSVRHVQCPVSSAEVPSAAV